LFGLLRTLKTEQLMSRGGRDSLERR